MLVFGSGCLDLFVLLLDFVHLASLLFAHSFGRLGPLLSILDLLSLGFVLFTRTFCRLGFLLPTFGLGCMEFSVLVLDSIQLELSFLARSLE